MEVKIEVPEDLFEEISTINTKGSISEYIIHLMKDDLRRQNIKDGLAVQRPPKPKTSGVRTMTEGEFSMAKIKIWDWLKEKFRSSNRKKCIKIRPDRTWPRESHDD